eukprot:CAMPEP_0197037530 /NCGR_PEP_ID=MMETSP1384-20130603/14717_1 /TAXON_ID=29189 /ORGANISM="Ammonia sp." /LENGTH=169 /DNA_ID=CAMNT_0042467843 /DNA_START=34 /DNA_END=543 /DNA_ORIENTATION=+
MARTIAANSIFNAFDLIVGLLIVVGAFVSFQGTFVGIIIPVYQVLFGVLIIIMVFYIPLSLGGMIPFYMNFLGRGLTFLFLGCLALVGPGDANVKIAVAVLTLIVAFTYIIFWILVKFGVTGCSLPPPFCQASSSEDDGGAASSKKPQNDEEAGPAPAYDDNDNPGDTR